MSTEKPCTKCKETKSLSEFGRRGFGYKSWCKTCSSSSNSARLTERRNTDPEFRAKEAARSAEWNKNNPDARSQYYKENKEKEKDTQRAWQKANRPWTTLEKKAYLKKWREDNKDLKNSYQRNRQHRLRANGGSVTHQEWLDLCAYYGNVCLKCGKEETTMDHVVPVSKGGTHSIENIQPLCGSCNSSKGTKTIDYRS